MSYKTSVAIAASASLSSAIDLARIVSDEGTVLKYPGVIGIYVPSTWTAADITFQSSEDGTNWYDVKDAAKNEYKLSVDAGSLITLSPDSFEAFKYLRLRSGTASSAVVQTTAVTLMIKLRMDTSDNIDG